MLLAVGVLSSCGTYRYYNPTPNPALFQNEGEVQLSGNIGSSGVSVRGAWAVSDNIGIIGTYHSAPYEYRSSEGEIGAGYYTNANPSGIFIGGGIGFGSNYEYANTNHTAKKYEGDFVKPFIQLNGGITGGRIIGGLRGDIIGTFKTNYLIYNGKHLDGSEEKIKSDLVLFEPGATFGLGTQTFRFDISTCFPIRAAFHEVNRRRDARTFPVTIGVGLRFIFGGKKEAQP